MNSCGQLKSDTWSAQLNKKFGVRFKIKLEYIFKL